jgi:hypothetical protein
VHVLRLHHQACDHDVPWCCAKDGVL